MKARNEWVWYWGDDPEAFADEIVAKFGFDPRKDNPVWGHEQDYGEGLSHTTYGFLCPEACIDQVKAVRGHSK